MTRGLATLTVLALTLAPCACGRPLEDEGGTAHPLTDDAATRPDRVLRLVLRLTEDGVETVEAIEAPGRVGRRDPYRSSPGYCRGFDRDGKVLFERGLRLETHLRSEVAGPDGVIEGRRIPLEQPVLTVLVPLHDELDRVRFYRASPGASRSDAEPIGEVRP
jgi:hypothetical protein